MTHDEMKKYAEILSHSAKWKKERAEELLAHAASDELAAKIINSLLDEVENNKKTINIENMQGNIIENMHGNIIENQSGKMN